MKLLPRRPVLTLCAPLVLAGCANLGPPEPPSLELPKPPTDLRATRKGNKVTLTWTIPTATTDRQTVRGVGPTRICRGTQPRSDCSVAVGEAAPQPHGGGAAGRKLTASYIDLLPPSLLDDGPSA